MELNECSHGKTWKQECPHCELIWWRRVEEDARQKLVTAGVKIREAKRKLSGDQK